MVNYSAVVHWLSFLFGQVAQFTQKKVLSPWSTDNKKDTS